MPDFIDEMARIAAFATPAPAKPAVWVAYYSDASQFGLFATEMEALRFAVKTHSGMSVKEVTLPVVDLMEALREKR